MKSMTYYVVEVAFSNVNPIHRAICFHRSGNNIELFASYDGLERTNVRSLAYFEVVEELESMRANFPNKHKTPAGLKDELREEGDI